MSPHDKLRRLRENLRSRPNLAIAFSGGIDSAFLLKVAAETLGSERVLAITARAVNFPEWEDREADAFARSLSVRHMHLEFDILALPGFVENSPERCYHCKKALFEILRETALQNGVTSLADGANRDDVGDYRPGMRATRELGVLSPLLEADIGKADIRALAKEMGIEAWNKPSFACLASRIPYGQRITGKDLEMIGKAEQLFLDLGFRNVRVRRHGDLARVEVNPDDRVRFFDLELMDRVDAELRKIGFAYAALDLRGYRTGSMNETIRA